MRKMGKIILGLLGFLILFLLLSYLNHRIQLNKEDAHVQPLGHQVQVEGHKMNVYTEGEGEKTLVFLAGGGTSSPILDFKSLFTLLSDEQQIVVVEKKGYGFSELANVERGIASILNDTRLALKLCEIEGPFVLVPHSMSGIEALYWAQQYPAEVEAIIGLDMAVPESYEDYPLNLALVKLGKLAADTGVFRWFPSLAESDAIKYGNLTETEQELYRIIFYRRTATLAMINEVENITENARQVAEGSPINIPVLMFSSNGLGTGWEEAQWRQIQRDFAISLELGQLIEVESSHYLHNIKSQEIATKIKLFLEEL